MRNLALALVLLSSPVALADGAATYNMMCTSCHGAAGAGDGAAAIALTPKPANFGDAEFWATRDDAHLKKVIKQGGAAVGKSPLMAPFGAALTDAQVDELIAYIKTFKK
jgi:mono/diheme cytochrome c family protein